MAIDKSAIATTYPLPSYNYKVTIDSETMAFTEVTGLNIEFEKVVYKHGLSFVMGSSIIRAQRNAITITLKRGVVAKRNYLYEWLMSNKPKDIFIDLCNELGVPLVKWSVIKALPLKLDMPEFNADGNEIAIESIELVAKDLTIQHL